jgi:hypothetical protein
MFVIVSLVAAGTALAGWACLVLSRAAARAEPKASGRSSLLGRLVDAALDRFVLWSLTVVLGAGTMIVVGLQREGLSSYTALVAVTSIAGVLALRRPLLRWWRRASRLWRRAAVLLPAVATVAIAVAAVATLAHPGGACNVMRSPAAVEPTVAAPAPTLVLPRGTKVAAPPMTRTAPTPVSRPQKLELVGAPRDPMPACAPGLP